MIIRSKHMIIITVADHDYDDFDNDDNEIRKWF
jgi:hypothetical protein